MQDVIDYYNSEAKRLGPLYENLSSDLLFASVIPYLPSTGNALDIGSGSGRDAAWLNRRGYSVTAVEPSKEMLSFAKKNHQENIIWLHDSLPHLTTLVRSEEKFNVILISAVWMHIIPEERHLSFKRIHNLLQSNGILIVTLRHGPNANNKITHQISSEEIINLSKLYNMVVELIHHSKDQLERSEVYWETIIMRRNT